MNIAVIGATSAMGSALTRMAVLLIGLSNRCAYDWRAGWKVFHG